MSVVTDAQDRITHLRGVLQQKSADMEKMSDNWKDETGKGHLVLSPLQAKQWADIVEESAKIEEAIKTEQKAVGIIDFLNAPQGSSSAGEDASATQRGSQRGEVKSLATEWLGSATFAEMKSSGFRNISNTSFEIERGVPDLAAAAAYKDVYSAMGGTVDIPVIGSAQALGWTERTLRPGRVRDLFPSERTSASMLYGIRESGFTNRASTVPQRTAADGTAATGLATDVFGLKPKSDLTIVPVTYPIATIAHIMYVHKNTLDDEPRMRGILDRDLIDGIKMAEDEQILWGDGVGENLTGLMNTQGLQTYTGQATDRRSAQVRRAATRAILAYFQPTGVVMHPLDWEHVELERDANGAYTVAVSVAVGGEKRVWRLSVTDSPAMRQGHALVGAFGTGAKLYDREQVNVVVSTENRDLFERNAYTLRAEERLGLVVDRPESFVHLSFTTPTVVEG